MANTWPDPADPATAVNMQTDGDSITAARVELDDLITKFNLVLAGVDQGALVYSDANPPPTGTTVYSGYVSGSNPTNPLPTGWSAEWHATDVGLCTITHPLDTQNIVINVTCVGNYFALDTQYAARAFITGNSTFDVTRTTIDDSGVTRSNGGFFYMVTLR